MAAETIPSSFVGAPSHMAPHGREARMAISTNTTLQVGDMYICKSIALEDAKHLKQSVLEAYIGHRILSKFWPSPLS